MPTVTCVLGTDAADAALNRPVAVLRAAEVASVLPLLRVDQVPLLGALLLSAGSAQRVAGTGQLPAIGHELRLLLQGIAAADLPDQLVPALALQRLATACATAQEFGFNLYLTIDPD